MRDMTDAPGSPHGLVGRDESLRRLVEVIARDGTIVVSGEPGIGKTTLLRAAATMSGRHAFEGGGFAILAWQPYLALARATERSLDGDADWVADSVERIVGPDVLLIDDLQSVDQGTLAVLTRLIGRIAILGATRIDDEAGHAAAATLTDAGAERLELAPLPPEAAIALIAAIDGDMPEARRRRIVDRAAGNPLILGQLAMAGETESLRRSVAARLDALEPVDREVLALIALADHPLPLDALEGGATRLVTGGFATPGPGGIAIRHALLADAVLDSTDQPTTTRLHERLAVLAASPGERARHLAAAGHRGEAHAAALEAVAGASSVGERAAHLGIAAATADGKEADVLRVDAAASLRIAGDLGGATAALDSVEGDDPETLARREAVRARVAWSAGDPDGMRVAIERGLALASGSGSVAEAMLRAEAVVITALVDGHFEEGLRDATAAIESAERADADMTRPLLLRATLLAGLGLDGWDAALEAVIAAARQGGDPETELSAANNLIAGHEMHGDHVAAREIASTMIERAKELHLTTWSRQYEAMLVNLDLHDGELDSTIVHGEALLEEALDPLAAGQVKLAVACALLDLGRAEEAGALLGRLLAEAPDDAVVRLGVLHVAAEHEFWSGRPRAALRRVEEARVLDAGDHPTGYLVDVVAGWAAIDATVTIPARLAQGEPEGMLAGAAAERDGIEALAEGEDARAAEAFALATRAYSGVHRRGELRARWAEAEARRRGGDVEGARTALEQLEVDAESQGFAPLAGRIRRSLRLVGVRRQSTGTPDGPGSAATTDTSQAFGPRLTRREREIVQLVASGASNVEIARRLGVGRPTVARLLSSAMDKLGVDSRGQVAARIDIS